jgi:hypothetical protein
MVVKTMCSERVLHGSKDRRTKLTLQTFFTPIRSCAEQKSNRRRSSSTLSKVFVYSINVHSERTSLTLQQQPVIKSLNNLLMSKTAAKTSQKVPVYLKYANTVSQSWIDPAAKLKPSDLVKPSIDVVPDDYPMIIEFNKMADNTSYVHSVVDIDQPLFQPSPKIVVFEEYGPFTTVEKKIYFRNKDAVRR